MQYQLKGFTTQIDRLLVLWLGECDKLVCGINNTAHTIDIIKIGVHNMKVFQTFLDSIEKPVQKARMEDILKFVKREFPQLKAELKWNQPMFIDHGTFIIGFSVAKGHIAVAPESLAIKLFESEIKDAGYSHTEELFRIRWADKVDYDLLRKLIAYNIEDKKDIISFWRR